MRARARGECGGWSFRGEPRPGRQAGGAVDSVRGCVDPLMWSLSRIVNQMALTDSAVLVVVLTDWIPMELPLETQALLRHYLAEPVSERDTSGCASLPFFLRRLRGQSTEDLSQIHLHTRARPARYSLPSQEHFECVSWSPAWCIFADEAYRFLIRLQPLRHLHEHSSSSVARSAPSTV